MLSKMEAEGFRDSVHVLMREQPETIVSSEIQYWDAGLS
jgi:hypothetical protein